MNIRQSAVAGVFYPVNADILSQMVSGFLDKATFCGVQPKILIAPHAGFIYSGQTAGAAYKQLETLDANIVYKILLLGTSHRAYFHGVAFSPSDAFATPLGLVKVDRDAINEFVDKSPFAFFNAEAHKFEHSLETQLPFLQKSLKNFTIIPAVYSDCDVSDVEATLEYFLKDEHTIAIISADLSHFHSYDIAMKLDKSTIDAIENSADDAITNDQTCGKDGICAAINYAKKHNLNQKTLDYKNSGDVSDDKASVVGYVSSVFY